MAPYLIFQAFAGIAAAMKRTFPPLWALFIIAALMFVGLRFETAFDWPVYKSQFEYLQAARFSSDSIIAVHELWNHEIGYVVLAFVAANVLPNYEWFQLIVFAFLLASIGFLARSLNEKMEGWALYIILSFLMFSLIMSTMRQCVALSVFNIGLGMFLRGKNAPGAAIALSSLLFHMSGIIYVGILAASLLRIPNKPRNVIVIAAVVALTANVLLYWTSIFDIGLFARANYYLEQSRDINFYEVLFFVFTMSTVFVFSLLSLSYYEGDPKVIVMRFCAIGSVLAVALLSVSTIRNRIFYEIVILSAILIPFYAQAKLFRGALIALSTFFFLAQFTREAAVAWLPYQSALEDRDGDGHIRQGAVRRMARERF